MIDVLLRAGRRRNVTTREGRTLGDVFLALDRLARRSHGRDRRDRSVNVGYLLAALDHWEIDEARRRDGRPRCGGCVHYGRGAATCLHSAAVVAGPIPPDAEPSRLDPPCPHFRSVRHAVPIDHAPPPVAAPPADPAERVARGLRRLERTDPAAAALLVLHHLDGRSLRALERELPHDRRELARRLRRAETALGRILEDLP